MKKIIPIVLIMSFFASILLLMDSNFYDVKNYPYVKIIRSSEYYKKNSNPYQVYNGLKSIENKHKVSIIKFTNFQYDNKKYFTYNVIGTAKVEKPKFFDKNIRVNIINKSFKDEKMVGFYFFTSYNKSIEKDLSSLGLSIFSYEKPKILTRISIIILDNYFLIILISLLLIRFLSNHRKKNSKNKLFLIINKNIIYIFSLVGMNIIFSLFLWFFSDFNKVQEIVCYYVFLSVIIILFIEIINLLFFYIKYNKLYIFVTKKYYSLCYFIGQSIVITLLYFCLLNLNTMTVEIYLHFINNPLKYVSKYSTTDLTSFNPTFYEGIKKSNSYYEDYLKKQNNIIISAYNVGYEFRSDNFNPYTGNSFLTTSKFFETQKIRDNKGKIFSFREYRRKNEIDIIIPFNKKKSKERIKKEYAKWMAFISDIPVQKLKINIHYSLDNQIIYSYGYQNSLRSLRMKTPVIMVVNPSALNNDEIVSLLSNRFITYRKGSETINHDDLSMYFMEINNIKNLMQGQSLQILIKWSSLALSLILLIMILIRKRNTTIEVLDKLIYFFFYLTFIVIIFQFNIISFVCISLIMIYILFSDHLKKKECPCRESIVRKLTAKFPGTNEGTNPH
ncbi:hypothetical protein [Streptococcus uberis]|uniref:hypothetical protein n=1 Tax=Streptococcus uberis TaxID=1349 RepID=UPI00193AC286|nr:hypothetical protein [Streptococcus uberis]